MNTDNQQWIKVGTRNDLVPQSGVCARLGKHQVGIFYLPEHPDKVFAIDNWDPIGKAAVLSRGIVCDQQGRWCVASPLYKQHFDLSSGECLEDPSIRVSVYPVRLEEDQVWLAQPVQSVSTEKLNSV